MKIGIDVFKEDAESLLRKRNFVLITGSSNVDSEGEPIYQVVKKAAGKRLKAIWSLQHGFFIDKQDNMILSDSFYWKDLDIEVSSLYGENLLPQPGWLEGIDALVIDLFDVGTRVYTFGNHVIMLMKYLSGKNIDIVVLDRPNPLNGLGLEGNVLDPGYFSIVGQLPVPMRHGLTVGEYLGYGLSYYDLDLQLEVVRIRDWKREQFFKGIWTYPSPNMPSFRTAVVYPGAVLLEGTNLSEGRGTTRPFELVGAPFIDHFKLVQELAGLKLKGVTFTPIFFKPEFSKYAGEVCKGILVNPHPDAVKEFKSFAVYYEIIRLVKAAYPDQFKWKEPPYEFEYQRLPFDMICGSTLIREFIEAGRPFKDIESVIAEGVLAYIETVNHFLLY
ncbi:MAG: hypothetical protein QG657_2562 [Acidobacteriota bacterium]|nr:hypothetical protein [Acidobacteriota bacterium]